MIQNLKITCVIAIQNYTRIYFLKSQINDRVIEIIELAEGSDRKDDQNFGSIIINYTQGE